jgi:hypothetical protein
MRIANAINVLPGSRPVSNRIADEIKVDNPSWAKTRIIAWKYVLESSWE